MKVVFDKIHGQERWTMPGGTAKTLQGSFQGFAVALQEAGYTCLEHQRRFDSASLDGVAGLVIPPPTGLLNLNSNWEWCDDEQLSDEEIVAIHNFIRSGGRMFACAYRFGQPFTKSNIGHLFAMLGCVLNDDAVMRRELALKVHPFQTTFETTSGDFAIAWASKAVKCVQWRPVCSFTVLPSSEAQAVAFSPSDCVRIQWPGRRLFHERAPICVCGRYGTGRYVLAGGPHPFESSNHGLLRTVGNSQFLRNLINWLFAEQASPTGVEVTRSASKPQAGPRLEIARQLWEKMRGAKKNQSKAQSYVEFVLHLLCETCVFRLHATSVWSKDREAEIDLVFECLSNKPLWVASGGVVPVECKNWAVPVDAPEISRFADKVSRTAGRIGIFAARSFTDASWSAVSKARLKDKTLIAVLSDEDIAPYLQGIAEPLSVIEGAVLRSMLL